MGVPYLFKWIRDTFGIKVVLDHVPGEVFSMAFDGNGPVHAAAQKNYAYGKFFNEARLKALSSMSEEERYREFEVVLKTQLNNAITKYNPVSKLILMIDGRAPMAKIQQQRSRRFRAALASSQVQSKYKSVFDSNCISPGTDFMKRVDQTIRDFVREQRLNLPNEVIYSPHDQIGEGEHKIMDIYRRMVETKADGGGNTFETRRTKTSKLPEGDIPRDAFHICYGLDADLIMLSLISKIRHIYLVREEGGEVLDIYELRKQLVSYLKVNDETKMTCYDDFVLMMFMIGNDFLPHIPSLNMMQHSINAFIAAYTKLGKSLTNPARAEILWPNFITWLGILQEQEPRLLTDISQKVFRNPSPILTKASEKMRVFAPPSAGASSFGGGVRIDPTKFDHNLFRQSWYNNIFQYHGDTKDIADIAQILNMTIEQFNPPINFNDQKQLNETLLPMCQKYLDVIAWNYRYYRRGTSQVSMNLYYPYHYAPLITDLFFCSQLYNPYDQKNFMPKPTDTPYRLIDQLISILPRQSFNLIPIQYTTNLNPPVSLLDLFPETFVIDREMTDEEWQGVALIPFVNIDRVVGFTASQGYGPAREGEGVTVWMFNDEQRAQRTSILERKRQLSARSSTFKPFVPKESNESTYDLKIDIDGIGFVPMIRASEGSSTRGGFRGRGHSRGGARFNTSSGSPNYSENQQGGSGSRGVHRGRGSRGFFRGAKY